MGILNNSILVYNIYVTKIDNFRSDIIWKKINYNRWKFNNK